MLRLKIKKAGGKSLGEQVIDRFPILVGRDPSCGLVLTESGISSKHVELDWDGISLSVRDVGSRNGTFVGTKEKIGHTKLQPPCSIRLGNVVVIDFELAEIGAAKRAPLRPLALPKPMKRPELCAQLPAPKPAPAVAEVPEPEEIEGWELYWHKLKSLPPRPLLFVMIGLGCLYSLMHMVVLQDGFFYSCGLGFGTALSCALIAVIMAALLALPGILFRRRYDFRPLFVQWCVGTMGCSFYLGILKPAFLMEYFGYVAQALSVLVLVAWSVTGCYIFVFNTFSHKHEKKLLVAAILFSFVSSGLLLADVFRVERQELMREALLGKHRNARGLAGSPTEIKAVTGDLRDFGRKFPAKEP